MKNNRKVVVINPSCRKSKIQEFLMELKRLVSEREVVESSIQESTTKSISAN